MKSMNSNPLEERRKKIQLVVEMAAVDGRILSRAVPKNDI